MGDKVKAGKILTKITPEDYVNQAVKEGYHQLADAETEVKDRSVTAFRILLNLFLKATTDNLASCIDYVGKRVSHRLYCGLVIMLIGFGGFYLAGSWGMVEYTTSKIDSTFENMLSKYVQSGNHDDAIRREALEQGRKEGQAMAISNAWERVIKETADLIKSPETKQTLEFAASPQGQAVIRIAEQVTDKELDDLTEISSYSAETLAWISQHGATISALQQGTKIISNPTKKGKKQQSSDGVVSLEGDDSLGHINSAQCPSCKCDNVYLNEVARTWGGKLGMFACICTYIWDGDLTKFIFILIIVTILASWVYLFVCRVRTH